MSHSLSAPHASLADRVCRSDQKNLIEIMQHMKLVLLICCLVEATGLPIADGINQGVTKAEKVRKEWI